MEKPLRFQYHQRDKAAFFSFREDFYRLINRDIVANTYGRLYDGEYYAVGNFPAETVETYDPRRRFWISEIPFFMPEEVWMREVGSYIFDQNGLTTEEPQDVGASGITLAADYPLDFPRGLTSGNIEQTIINDAAFPSPFRLAVYGPCTNPTVTIAGHVYNVVVEVPTGARLIVDSAAKTAEIVDAANGTTNVFAYQNHDADKYLFAPIATGECTVFYQNIPKIILTLYEERSATKWT